MAFGGHAGDNRNWSHIDAWAQEIAAALPALDKSPIARVALQSGH
jgi:hypothetical protein